MHARKFITRNLGDPEHYPMAVIAGRRDQSRENEIKLSQEVGRDHSTEEVDEQHT